MSPGPKLLPAGIEEVLPPYAYHFEMLRRKIIDLFSSWGYELVIPPLVEYLDTLLTNQSPDLDLQTIKITDQLSGRLMGVRADMTPQVARIDAYRLKRDIPTRLCYLGPVLHATPQQLGESRNPFQVGAELFGHAGVESDAEILMLMLETLKLAGIKQLYIELNHAGIMRSILAEANLSPTQEQEIYDCLQRKVIPDLKRLLVDWQLDETTSSRIMGLIQLNGDVDVIQQAEELFANGDQVVLNALEELKFLTDLLRQQMSDVFIHVDLAEVTGYDYHTGVMFAAYAPEKGQALARGGRYDGISEAFGRNRPATGFSTDLKLIGSFSTESATLPTRILAPTYPDSDARAVIAELRAAGHQVISYLPQQKGVPHTQNYDQQLQQIDGKWQIQPITL